MNAIFKKWVNITHDDTRPPKWCIPLVVWLGWQIIFFLTTLIDLIGMCNYNGTYQVVAHLYLRFYWLLNTIQFEYHSVSTVCTDSNYANFKLRGANGEVLFHCSRSLSLTHYFFSANNMFFTVLWITHAVERWKLDAARSCFKSIKCI